GEERAPVSIAGELVPEGLRVTLTNVGATLVTVNPVALRYGTGELTLHEFSGGGAPRSYRQLKLTLGFVRANTATPADRLVPLAPKMEHSWVVPLRAEDRDVDHICVEMMDGFAIRGKPVAPPLDSFSDAWVK